MTNALISFVAKLGSDITLQDPQALVQAAQAAGLSEQQTEALLLKQRHVLASELDLRKDIVCLMVPAEGEESEEQKNEDDDKDAPQNASIKIA